jgi:hypothetical protein
MLEIELKMLRILSQLSADHCVVTELSGNGDADVNDGFKIVHVTLDVRDACINQLDGPRPVYQVKKTEISATILTARTQLTSFL